MLTFYELLNGDMTLGQGEGITKFGYSCSSGINCDPDFHDMDPEVFQRALNVLVKRGKASVFGEEDQRGVKFF